MHVTLLDRAEEYLAWLNQRNGVSEVQIDGDVLNFTNKGGKEDQADLLRMTIEAGFRVVEFGSRTRSLAISARISQLANRFLDEQRQTSGTR